MGCKRHFTGTCVLLLVLFAFLVVCSIEETISGAVNRLTTSCIECGALYKFCPSEVGCGFADASGITCYCQDWTWCSDNPQCSAPVMAATVSSEPFGLGLLMVSCNGTDERQWIQNMDPSCATEQVIMFSARDESNNVFVLAQDPLRRLNASVIAAYVTTSAPFPLIYLFPLPCSS